MSAQCRLGITIVLGLTLFGTASAAAQGCTTIDPPCPPDDPPAITITPSNGTYSQNPLSVSIYYHDDYGIQAQTIGFGVTGATILESYQSCSGSSSCYVTLKLQLQPGSGNMVTASVMDGLGQSGGASATFTYTPPPPPPPRAAPVIGLGPHNGQNRVMGLCVAACFENVLAYSTATYTSLDVSRAVTLVHSTAQNMTRATVQIDATDGSAETPAKMSLRLRRPDQSWVTFSNGLDEVFFSSGTGTTRLAAQFDAGGLGPGALDYTAVVRTWWPDGGFLESTAPIKVSVVRSDWTHYGYGWWIAGLQRVIWQSDGIVVLNGDGSIAHFKNCPTSCATYVSPAGDFSTMTWIGGTGGVWYRRASLDGTRADFDWDGRMTVLADRHGNQTTFAYTPGTFKLISITDPVGMVTTLAYDAAGKLDYIQDPGGRVTQVAVDAAGDLTEIRNPDGISAMTTVYANHVPQSVTDRRGGLTSFAYDMAGKLSEITAPSVSVNGQSIRPVMRLRSIEVQSLAPAGQGSASNPATRRISDSLRALVKGPKGADSTLFALNGFGQATLAQVRDPRGKWLIAKTTYDEHGRPTFSVSPEGNSTTYTWSGADLTAVLDDNTGSTTSYLYEPTYHQIKEVRVEGVLQQQNWHGTNGRLDSTKVGTSKTQYAYDSRGRVTGATDPGLHSTTIAYYPAGTQNTWTVTAPLATGANGTTTLEYDAYGRVTRVTDPTGRVASTFYNVLNGADSVTGPLGSRVRFGYNDATRTYTVTDANNQVYTEVENLLGWVEQRIDPRNKIERFEYDSAGNVVRYTNRRNGVVSFTYDTLSRPLTIVTGADTTKFAYDSSGLWFSAENSESIDTLRTDTNNRLAETIIRRAGLRFALRPGYEPVGLRNGVTVERTNEWSRYISFGYDARYWNNLVQNVSGAGTSIARNAEHLPSIITASGIQQTFNYKPTHQVADIGYSSTAVGDAFARSYSYGARGVVDTVRWGYVAPAEGMDRRALKYDDLDRLTSYRDYHDWAETQEICPDPFDPSSCYTEYTWHTDLVRQDSITYDAVGNRTDRNASILTGNRLATFDGYALTYDDDGNLLSKTKAGFTQTFTWNDLGQLTRVVTNGTTAEFGYDAFGRRVRKTVNGVSKRYLWDGDDLIVELGASWSPDLEYTYFPGTDNPHSVRTAGGSVAYYAPDQPGHVAGLFTDLVQAQYEYTPWGELLGWWEAFPQPLRFAAREYDSETGLYYMRARYYDPTVGRFISEDPIGLEGGINPYAYAANNPLSYRDPFGTSSDEKPCPKGYELMESWDIELSDGTTATVNKCQNAAGETLTTWTNGTLPPIVVTACAFCGPYDFQPGRPGRGQDTYSPGRELGLFALGRAWRSIGRDGIEFRLDNDEFHFRQRGRQFGEVLKRHTNRLVHKHLKQPALTNRIIKALRAFGFNILRAPIILCFGCQNFQTKLPGTLPAE